MTEPVPYYQRTLDSFADHIITKAWPRKDGSWHAVLDCSFKTSVSDPDFSPYGYGKDAAEAAAKSAKAIRNDAIGIGKFAPHSVLRADRYDLHFRLMRHWERKERFEAVGINPNDMIRHAAAANWDDWNLEGEWLDCSSDVRTREFCFQLYIAETMFAVREGNLELGLAKETIINAMKAEAVDVGYRTRPTEATWARVNDRIDSAILDISASFAGPKL